MQRRHVLVGVGSAVLGAGCLDGTGWSPGDDGSDGPDETTATAPETTTTETTSEPTTRPPTEPGPCPDTLFPVRLLNRDDAEHVLAVTVTDADGESVLDDRFEVAADTRGQGFDTGAEVRYRDSYAVDVAMDGEDAASERVEIECGSLYVLVHETADVEVLAATERE